MKLAIYGFIALAIMGSLSAISAKLYYAGDFAGYARRDAEHATATAALNDHIDKLQKVLATERATNRDDRALLLQEALVANTGEACVPDEKYRARLNGLLR